MDAAAHGVRFAGDVLDHGGDFLEGAAGGVDGIRAALRPGSAFLHDLDGVLCLFLNRGDQRGDLVRRGARLLGELSNLLGDDGEASPVLACARRLDGGIEREEIRLIGDGGDGVDDRADLVGFFAEHGDDFGGARYGLCDALHLQHGFVDSGCTLRCRAVCSRDGVDGLREVFGESAHVLLKRADLSLRAIHLRELLVARVRHLRHGGSDLGTDRGRLVGALVELGDGSRDLSRRLDGLLHHLPHVVLQSVERLAHPADLIRARNLGLKRGAVAEVSLCERGKTIRHMRDGAGKFVAEEDRQGDAKGFNQDGNEHCHAQAAVKIRIDGFLLCGDERVDLVDPDACAQDPLVRREGRGIIALGQRCRLSRFGKAQVSVAAAWLPAVFQHLLDEVDAVGIDEVDA